MARQFDHVKDTLVEGAIAAVRDRVGAGQEDAAERFLRAFHAQATPEELLHREPEALVGAPLSLFQFALLRTPGRPSLRVYHPHAGEGGWDSPHSVVETVNDDMPFLVDSLTAALDAEGIALHRLVHPILPVRRDLGHRLVGIGVARTEATNESWIQIEIDWRAPEEAKRLARRLEAVLAAVATAVGDWRAMRERMLLAQVELEAGAGPADEVAEARDFLRWLHDDHFTFLGACNLALGPAQGPGEGIVEASRLGILRDPAMPIFDKAGLPLEAASLLGRPQPLFITKSTQLSAVHRAVPMDIVAVKRYDGAGKVAGLHVILGLMGSALYNQAPTAIPYLRRRVALLVQRAGFNPASHDGRVLQAVLESYPRDELLQAGDDHLFTTALAILHLQEQRRTALFLRRDDFDRFVSALVYVPRDRYDSAVLLKVQAELEVSLDAEVTTWHTQLGDAPLARLSFMLRGRHGSVPEIDAETLESRLAEATRSWSDRLHEAMVEELGEDRGLGLFRRWGQAFPGSYRESTDPQATLADIQRIEAGQGQLALHLYRPPDAGSHEARFKIYRAGEPVPLSDVLPVFENLGFRVIAEMPHALHPGGDTPLWIQDFSLQAAEGETLDPDRLHQRLEETFAAVWRGEADNDGYNRLVLKAGLSWRQAMVLRAYSRYLRQTGTNFSPSYVLRSVVANPAIAALLVRLFERRFDPAGPDEGADLVREIESALDSVSSADEDRILRRFLDMVDCTLRTNYFQRGGDGAPKPRLAVKLDSRRLAGLPAPRPMVEIFVFSARMEGIHLRGGKVARGGIRWSDRPEDFRTEILGLMKAQMVKNAVIVPVGSKGGFILKRVPARREELLAEGEACYRILISGLLDLTDNYAGQSVVPPEGVVRRDGDDPYLVVAADKGTATFSDIANSIAINYGYWLGDAFASGGSVGYDHKAMGITARGAWESVKRHFRELGRDIQSQDFTVVGVGDMSGDVFGNGMLLSPHTRLLAAFDHRHIFLDPDPDPAAGMAERHRLFDLPRSSWADYDPARLSAGGGVFPRDAKHVPLSPEVRRRFGLAAEALTPPELIRRLLTAEIDLLWFGGIGTYIKASGESNADVGDRANDALRVDASTLRCQVIGEGANLGMTQLGRVEAATAGRKLNTDAIDNSAGVDTSDHEVNIKILLDAAVEEGTLPPDRRAALLGSMTGEMAQQVLRDNYLQTQAISLAESRAAALLDQEERFMRVLEQAGRLDRAVEFLPGESEINRRLHAGRGLVRPELSTLLAYAKLWLFDVIHEFDLADEPLLFETLVDYFPEPLHGPDWRRRMGRHRLRREIIATALANDTVNRVGPSMVSAMVERTGSLPADVVRAYLVIRDAYELPSLWRDIEALDASVPAATQLALLAEIDRLAGRGVSWLLAHEGRPISFGAVHKRRVAAIRAVRDHLLDADGAVSANSESVEALTREGVPDPLARRIAQSSFLASALDIADIAEHLGQPIPAVASLYFAVAEHFDLAALRALAERLAGTGHWDRLAVQGVADDIDRFQAALTASVASQAEGRPADEALAFWIKARSETVARAIELFAEVKAASRPELASLVVAAHHLRALGAA